MSRLWSRLLLWLSATFRRSHLERDMDAELRFHIETCAAELARSGVPQAEALRRARIEFGSSERAKEECREARGVTFLETLTQDLRFGARILRKSPGFAVAAILTLALGIGSTAAVFSVVNTVLLKPLPYPHPDQIVMPWWAWPVTDLGDDFPWGQRDFLAFQRQVVSFQSVGAFKADSFNLTGLGDPIRLDGIKASAGFFPALGVSPLIGRTFTAQEEEPGQDLEVVLSHSLWLERFGGDPGALGRSINLNGLPYTVIGVMPPGFVFPRGEEMPVVLGFPRQAQLWIPNPTPLNPAGPQDLAVVGRLKNGVTFEQAFAELKVFGKDREREYPQAAGYFTPRLSTLGHQVVGDSRRPLLLLLGAVAVVLLIACSNVANLLLARSLLRGKEFTLRSALGAGRGRLLRQLLVENLLLAVTGGLFGTLMAWGGVFFARTFGPSTLPRLHEVTLDLRVFAFALGVACLTGVVFGLPPAFAATREGLVESLKERGQSAAPSARLRSTLLVSQVALALVLVFAAGLLVRTFYSLLRSDAGFNASRVFTFQLTLPAGKYSDVDAMARVYHAVLERLRSTPGVEQVGFSSAVPLGGAPDNTGIRIPDRPVTSNKQTPPTANYLFATPGYFAAVGTPLLRGREFAESDIQDSQHVAIITAAMAQRYWPGLDPLGKQVGVGLTRFPLRTIVGIVADTKHTSLSEKSIPEMYVPYTQNEIKVWPNMQTMQVALRTAQDPASVVADVRRALNAVDPDLPLAKPATLLSLIDDSVVQPRFSMLLLASFGGIALLLASIGMYGVVSYSVARRTREIGIRMALGAAPRQVFRMVLSQGARFVAMGIAIGLVASFAVARLMSSFLFGVRPTDPSTYLAVCVLLTFVVLLATYLPARRATRVDPTVALREQ
jgi:putative ABC transport system permease protein